MKTIKNTSLDEFYEEAASFRGKEVIDLLPPDIHKEIGHFNVFDVAETMEQIRQKPVMPYNRRAYYKISLISGRTALSMRIKSLISKKMPYCSPRPKYLITGCQKTLISRVIFVCLPMSF